MSKLNKTQQVALLDIIKKFYIEAERDSEKGVLIIDAKKAFFIFDAIENLCGVHE